MFRLAKAVARRIDCRIVTAVAGVAFVVTGAMGGVDFSDVRDLCAFAFISAIGRWTALPWLAPQAKMRESFHQQGYDEGWHDGHRVARPVVVPLPVPDDAREILLHR